MRKKGSVFLMSNDRDKDLIRAYREVIKKQLNLYGRITATGIMAKVVNSPASRYWVSSERAYSVILKMDKGESISYMKTRAQVFYRSLYKDFCVYRESHSGLPSKYIVEIVIQRPAPCFMISPAFARNIIFRMKKQCWEEKMRRLKSR